MSRRHAPSGPPDPGQDTREEGRAPRTVRWDASEPSLGQATADLHAHTSRSDGLLEPIELVGQARACGIRLLAISDHDTLLAFRELRAAAPATLPADLELVPAVEINARADGFGPELPEGELHILGLGVDPDDESFEAVLAGQRASRRIRFGAMVDRLRGIGLSIDDQLRDLDRTRDDALGRPTLARALVAAGHAATVEDAFLRIVGRDGPGYVPRAGLGPLEAIRAIRLAGGLASLAHFDAAPHQLALLRELRDAGLGGLETHHRSFDAETRAAMVEVARELSLVQTGGTDYHGDTGPYAESHAELVLPDALVAGVRAMIDPTRNLHT
jgi:predicted metal-dependent phosphoesterase TrpH